MFASHKMWKTKKELLKKLITLSNFLIFSYHSYKVTVKIVTMQIKLQTILTEFNALANPHHISTRRYMPALMMEMG
jgi:hypothetical protein